MHVNLQADQEHFCRSTVFAFEELTERRCDLLEVCAPWDSPLSEAVEKAGDWAIRIGLHNGYDLSTKEGLHKAMYLLRKVRPKYVHVSPPYCPFSCMQNANQRTET